MFDNLVPAFDKIWWNYYFWVLQYYTSYKTKRNLEQLSGCVKQNHDKMWSDSVGVSQHMLHKNCLFKEQETLKKSIFPSTFWWILICANSNFVRMILQMKKTVKIDKKWKFIYVRIETKSNWYHIEINPLICKANL